MEAIALIGIGCRFPGGVEGPSVFWERLRCGFDAIGQLSEQRYNLFQTFEENLEAVGVSRQTVGGFLSDVDMFDARFFCLSPRAATRMDPQQRLFLEVGWEALTDAGQSRRILEGSRTGVFVGVSSCDYERLLSQRDVPADLHAAIGSARHAIAGRLSHFLKLVGPSLAVDTSTSSALTAVHLACESLISQECDLAIAGGVHLVLDPRRLGVFFNGGLHSVTARCRFGDEAAERPVLAEGVGAVVLKRLSAAIDAEDRVYAVILSTAMRHEGGSGGSFGTPSRKSQEELLRAAYQRAIVEPSEVAYVECHGAGTPVGDPIELGAIASVLGCEGRRGVPLAVGSVKTNIGHTDSTAGIAGVIKAALSLHNRATPPSLHCRCPRTDVAWGDSGLMMQRELTAWPEGESPRIFGVTSLGLTGANVHAVIAEVSPSFDSHFMPPERPRWRRTAFWAVPICGRNGVDEGEPPCTEVLPLGSERLDSLTVQLRDVVAEVMHSAPAEIPVDRSLVELGVDSLLVTDLQQRIGASFCLAAPDGERLLGLSLRDLSAWLAEQRSLIAALLPLTEAEDQGDDDREVILL